MPAWAIALLIGGISILLGGIFITIAAIRTRMTRGWVRTTGIVVDQRTGRADGGIPALYPTFQWQDANGRVHQHTSMVSASLGPRPGKRLAVLYDPRNPARAILDTFVQSGRIFYLVGGLVTGIGVLAALFVYMIVSTLAATTMA